MATTFLDPASYSVAGFPPTAVLGGQFKDDELLIRIVLPPTVNSIGARAFDGCINLTSVVLPIGLREIGPWAFRGCRCLTSVDFADTAPAAATNDAAATAGAAATGGGEGLKTIRKCAFRDCTRLTSIMLPATLKVIEERAFKNCKLLFDLELPPGLVYLGASAFQGCLSLDVVVLPVAAALVGAARLVDAPFCDSQEDVHQGVFEGCSNLCTLVAPIATYDSASRTCSISDNGGVADPVQAGGSSGSVSNGSSSCSTGTGSRGSSSSGGVSSLVARVQKPACFKGCIRIERVSAPDSVVAALNLAKDSPATTALSPSTLALTPTVASTSLLELPQATVRGWAQLQLDFYFWSIRLHHSCPPQWRWWVRTTLLAGQNYTWRHSFHVPPEMWHYILKFVKLGELGSA